MEEKLGHKLVRAPAEAVAPRPAFDRLAHIGAHPQKQPGLCWLGVVLPVGKLTAAQMQGLAAVAREFGDGEIRLTVWQNLLISGVPAERVAAAEAAIAAIGLSTQASSIRAGLVACTGNSGCRLAASDTKRHAEEIARWCESRVQLDSPVNIHLTGCPNSCAQHYIGDISCSAPLCVSGKRCRRGATHLTSAAASAQRPRSARELYRDVKAEDAPKVVERVLKSYLAHRASPAAETFPSRAVTQVDAQGAVRANRRRVTDAALSGSARAPTASLAPLRNPWRGSRRQEIGGRLTYLRPSTIPARSAGP
jgi:ferredoxin-nitrite reductase